MPSKGEVEEVEDVGIQILDHLIRRVIHILSHVDSPFHHHLAGSTSDAAKQIKPGRGNKSIIQFGRVEYLSSI